MRAALALCLLAAAGYFALSYQRYAALDATVFDLGIHYQTVWLLGRGLDPWLTTRGLDAYADHFNPVAGLFAVLCRLWDSPVTLLAAQALLLAGAGLPLYALARRRLPAPLAAAACVLFWVQPGLLGMSRFDFHFTAVMVPASLGAAWALETGCLRAYAWSLLFLLTSTESAGLTVLGLVPVAARLRGRRWALATAAAGGLGLGLAALSLARHGEGLPTQYLSLYSHPSWHAGYLAPLLGGWLALPLLSPLRLLPALPVLAGNLLSWRVNQHSYHMHYEAAVVGFLAWAAVDVLRRLPARAAATLVALSLAATWLLRPPPPPPMPPLPAGWSEVRRRIPADAAVAADNFAGVPLAGRPQLFLLPNPFHPAAWGNHPQALVETLPLTRPGSPGELRRGIDQAKVDDVVLRLDGFGFPERDPDRWLTWYALLGSRRYGPVQAGPQLLLWQRGAPWSDEREKLLLRPFQ